jgi:predicted LPLAT superfamily acyltransferase
MSEWKGKSRGGIAGYKIFVWVLQTFGLKAAYGLLAFVCLYYIPFAPKASMHSYRYFRRIQKFGIIQSLFSVYRSYFWFGQTLIDRVAVMAGIPTTLTFEFDGLHYLEELSEKGSGAVLISAHCGNWEVAGHFFHQVNTRVNIVMYDEEHQRIKKFLESVQTNKNPNQNVHIIPVKDDLSHVVLLNKSLENKEFLCMHGDRFPAGSKSFSTHFMGYPASFPTGPFYLAGRYKMPVSFVFAFKEGYNHYHLYATPPRIYEITGNPSRREEILHEIIRDYVAALEEKVKRYPLQWFNYYKFWD